MTTRTQAGNGQRTVAITAELGVNATARLGATLYDDFLPQLRGSQGIKVWREMSTNDATIGAILFGIDQLLRGVEWNVEAAGEEPADEENANFLYEQMEDMTTSWSDFISSVLTMLPYGWAFHETVYRRRLRSDGSKYDDGRIGWRKHALRPQESLVRFDLDETGGLRAFVQSRSGGSPVVIPIEKGLLFRASAASGSPTGRSILRTAYPSYFYKKRATEIMMVGLDRDLTGLPVGKIPAESLIAKDDTYEAVKKIVTRTKRDEQEGIVWPLEYDENGNPLYVMELLQTGGRGKIDPIAVIRMFANDIAGSVLATFLSLGRDAVGSRALAEPMQELFRIALEAWLTSIADVLNRHAVPRLFALNGIEGDLPTFKPAEIKDVDLLGIGQFMVAVAQAGIPLYSGDPNDPIVNQVRQMAGFDSLDPESLADLEAAPEEAVSKRWNEALGAWT
jgi:hypothetical protein